MARTLIVGEIFEGKVRKPTFSAVSFAHKIEEITGAEFDVLIPGKGASQCLGEITRCGAKKVYVADWDRLDNPTAERVAPIVEKVFKDGGYNIAASAADVYGKDLMPRVACALDCGMVSDITGIRKEENELIYMRPIFAGNVVAKVKVLTPNHVVTVRQTDFPPHEQFTSAGAEVINVDAVEPEASASNLEVIKFEKIISERPELTEAKVVVSGGRGLKSKENFKMIEQLADLMGGAVGATRAAVDAGFVPNDLQVGQTGKIVAPELYFAIGLSGAIQHLAGMKGSKVIVAINKDEEAPIFSVADYGIVADLFKIVPQLIEEIKKVKKEAG